MNIYDYTDYRKFLLDFYTERKAKYDYFSVRYIAENVGFQSASFFSQLVKGRSNMSVELIRKFSTFLGFSKIQSEYFETLVLYNQSKTHDKKKLYFEKLSSFRNSKLKQIDSRYFEFYDKWYYSAIRELLYIYPFKDNIKELSKLLIPSISPQETRKAIENLIKWGLIIKDDQGHYVRSDNFSITTGPDAQSFYLNNYQHAVLQLAKSAIDNFPKDTRQFSTLTMSLSPEGYSKFTDALQEFRCRLLKIAEQDSSEDRVYQLNMQLFPLTKQIKRI